MSRAAEIGRIGEDIAGKFLERRGCRIRERNFRVQGGEIDLIAETPDGMLLFVEVKTRKQAAIHSAYDAITPKKQRLLARAALLYCASHADTEALQPRFDVAVVSRSETGTFQISWIRNAFDVSDFDIIF